MTLFDAPATTGRVRRDDPVTSVEAARHPKGGLRDDVLEAFYRHGRMCDAQLCTILLDRLAASVITARSALKADGLVEATGTFRVNRRGRRQIVWQLSETGRERARVMSPNRSRDE